MTDPDISFEVYTIESEEPSDRLLFGRADDEVLPEVFAGYTRSPRDLVVMANREGLAVGMGGGWIYEHAAKAPLLLVKAAEVNDSFRNTRLAKELVAALLTAAKEKGFAGICLSEQLRLDDN